MIAPLNIIAVLPYLHRTLAKGTALVTSALQPEATAASKLGWESTSGRCLLEGLLGATVVKSALTCCSAFCFVVAWLVLLSALPKPCRPLAGCAGKAASM